MDAKAYIDVSQEALEDAKSQVEREAVTNLQKLSPISDEDALEILHTDAELQLRIGAESRLRAAKTLGVRYQTATKAIMHVLFLINQNEDWKLLEYSSLNEYAEDKLGEYFGYNPLDPATRNRLTYLQALCNSVTNVLNDLNARHIYDENGEKVTAERVIEQAGSTALKEISYAYSRATDDQKAEIALKLVQKPKISEINSLKSKVLGGGMTRFEIGAVEMADGNYQVGAILTPAEFAYLKAKVGDSVGFSFELPSERHG
jgi:hypothetical protein